ncbi:Pantothenate kinase 4 [Blattella germanica]|nr:Pantothenate kinase 4 [Blattella germanica]
MDTKSHPKSIKLPDTVEVFGNLKNAKRFAIDIGNDTFCGSLTKIAYYSTISHRRVLYEKEREDGKASHSTDEDHCVYEVSEGARLHFIKFETKYIESCLDFIQLNLVNSRDKMIGKVIKATGGGAYKYTELLQQKLGLSVDKEDEMSCLIKGCNFLLKNISDEAFVYQRHGGTATGGGTFWGLGSLLTKATGFDELLELAEKGDHRNVDMLVRDIYGGDYKTLGLPGDLIASSFGKAMHCHKDPNFNADSQFSEADLARSLLFTISNDVGQVASLYAMMHKLNKVYFGDADKYSWLENYAGSSGLRSPIPTQVLSAQGVPIDQLEIDRWESAVTYCPLLLDPANYIPDTVDLTQDTEAREYWLQCFKESVDKFVTRAVHSQPHSLTAKERAEKFKEKYISRLHAYGNLSVRSLLDTIEHCMKEFDFPDPYLVQKQMENDKALSLLGKRLEYLDSLEWYPKQEALVTSVLAGNMFDWGAREVADLMENTDFGFNEARSKIEARPWLVDGLDAWLDRLKGPPHNRLNLDLATAMSTQGVDLVVLEGMGRALHTNLEAKFTCECLKVAVIKNRWLANRLGGDMFSVLCKYERPNEMKTGEER